MQRVTSPWFGVFISGCYLTLELAVERGSVSIKVYIFMKKNESP